MEAGGNIYYMGMSNGAVLVARYGHMHPEIKRMLLINGPLMINWPQYEVIVKTIPKADYVFRGTENVLLELIEEIIR